jgi:pimeloyl-ACP methyl ester carboxylesterase
MTKIRKDTLQVPGATLPYTIRGSGPMLLLIAGGDGGEAGYDNLADKLAERYTVITYGRRGTPGSRLDDPHAEVRLETHSDDAHRLLLSLTHEPAYVFGSSAGALVGLDLAIRFPGQVRTLVAHEPPAEGILPEFDRYHEEMAEAQKQNDPLAIIRLFAQLGVRFDDLEPGIVLPQPDPQESAARTQALMRYTFPAVHRYRLDIDALAASPVRLILAGGRSGRETITYRCTQALAERLGLDMIDFPSDHAGYISHPGAFASQLDRVLKGNRD